MGAVERMVVRGRMGERGRCWGRLNHLTIRPNFAQCEKARNLIGMFSVLSFEQYMIDIFYEK